MDISGLWSRYLQGFLREEGDPSVVRRIKFAVAFTLMGSLAQLGFGLLRIWQGRWMYAAADIILASYLLGTITLLRLQRRPLLYIPMGLAGLFLFLMFLFATGGANGLGSSWLYFFPVTAFFLCGRRGGVKWMGIMFLSMFGLYLLQHIKLASLHYPFATGLQIIASLLVEAAMVYYYASIKERDEDQIGRHNQSLEQANQSLEKEMIQRRQAEQELLRIRQAVNSLGDAVVIADATGRHIFHNPMFFQMFGYSLEEINQAGGIGFLFRDLQTGRRLMDNLLEGKGFVGEVEMHDKNGRLMTIALRADAIKGPEGKTMGLVAVHVDITRYKLAERALKQSEERFRQVIGSISAHIYVTRFDTAGKPANDYISPNVEGMTGYPLRRFENDWKFWADQLILGEDQPAARAQAEKFRLGLSSEVEYRIKKQDGSVVWVRDSGRVERNKQTGEITVYGVVSDITANKHQETVKESLLQDLKKANQELSEFAYIVSHDLKAPLRAISSLAQWLGEDYKDALDKEGKEKINLLLGRTKRMHNLIEGVLAYSRLGRMKPTKCQLDSHEETRQIIDLLSPPPHIKVDILGRLPQVVCDRIHFNQVMQNLVSNAVKYNDKENGWIKISCSENKESWEYCISDNGAGIEEQYFERIFKIFQSLKARDEYESTGLGLTIVKKIVEYCGGKVWLTSQPGEGSQFFFTIPKDNKTTGESRTS